MTLPGLAHCQSIEFYSHKIVMNTIICDQPCCIVMVTLMYLEPVWILNDLIPYRMKIYTEVNLATWLRLVKLTE